MKDHSTTRVLLTFGIILGLQACAGEPSGQVVAIVNGEEITQVELNSELSELPANVVGDDQAIRGEVLRQIVDRRILAQLAAEEGFDRDPIFITNARRLREQLLVKMYGDRQADSVRLPDTASVKKYLADHPKKFSERTAYVVDQIVFDLPNDDGLLKELELDKTLEDVEETLSDFDVEFQRGPNRIDSLTVDPGVMEQLLALPDGEPFVLPAQGRATVSVIVGSEPIPSTEEDAISFAAQEMRAKDLQERLRSQLDQARSEAEIIYQDGFEPIDRKPS